jgi:hypothetical protein
MAFPEARAGLELPSRHDHAQEELRRQYAARQSRSTRA